MEHETEKRRRPRVKCSKAKQKTNHRVQGRVCDTDFAGFVFFFPRKGCCRGIPVPVPLLIIPIIMAHYENVINNTEDIVVAISHMVVGLCSVTILPLASTYVCQRPCSHDKLKFCSPCTPHWEPHTGGGGSWVFLLASRLSEFFMQHPVGLGTKCQPASGMAHQTLMLLGKGGKKEGGRRRHETRRIICACVFKQRQKKCVDAYMSELSFYAHCIFLSKHAHEQTH